MNDKEKKRLDSLDNKDREAISKKGAALIPYDMRNVFDSLSGTQVKRLMIDFIDYAKFDRERPDYGDDPILHIASIRLFDYCDAQTEKYLQTSRTNRKNGKAGGEANAKKQDKKSSDR